MGFDCTFHLIDEQAIREEFVPRLLGHSLEKTALDRVREDADELWNTVRESLVGDDPESAASLVCQLAVMFSACSLPHQYERGFALCLWEGQEQDIAVEYPVKFSFSPEPLFDEVVKAHPSLRGHFPTWFNGNYSTGVFIPSRHVPEALAWVEDRVATFAEGHRRRFKGLIRILRAAAGKDLAYWEATDLAVPMADQFPGAPDLMIADFLGNEPGTPNPQVKEAPITGHISQSHCDLHDRWLISSDSDPFETGFWDMSVWPPRLEYSLPEFAVGAARSRDGRWLLFSETDSKAKPRTFRPRLFSDLSQKPDGVFPALIDGNEISVRLGGFFGDRPLVFIDPPSIFKPGDLLPPPLWLDGNEWKPVPDLPAAEIRPSAIKGWVENPVVGVVHLADGCDALLWDGAGYEQKGARFEMTFSMGARASSVAWSTVPAGADGFFYLSNRCLFEIHRHSQPKAHGEEWTNIMFIRPGPAGGILLQEGDNPDGDVAKLYFPGDGEFIHLKPELFDDSDYPLICWSAPLDCFVALRKHKVLAIPTSAALSLPRHPLLKNFLTLS
jgi:hypothetical protein